MDPLRRDLGKSNSHGRRLPAQSTGGESPRRRRSLVAPAARQPAAYHYTGVGVETVLPSSIPGTEPLLTHRQPVIDQEEDDRQLTAPIRLRGQTFGTIALRRDPEEEPWSDEEIALVKQLSTQIGLALENARLLEETQQRAERERIIAGITAQVRSSMDPRTILQTAVRELGTALGTDRAFVQLGAGRQTSGRETTQE